MSYGDDFASVDTAGAPLDPTVMIGADPFFWGAVLLALAAALLAGFWFGARAGARRPDAASAIWTAIDDAVAAAMKADTESLPAHASHLHRLLRARLGRTLDFGGGLNRRVDALDRAIGGETGHEDGHAGHDHPAEAPAPATEREPASPTASAAANVTIVSVHGAAPAPHEPHPPRPGRRPMTTKQRNDALRLAVADFNDHWRHRPAREADMRAVVAELSDPGPARPGRH